MSDSDRWIRVKQLFAEAAEIAPEKRPGFLEASCGDDHELRAELESLLDADAESILGTEDGAPRIPFDRHAASYGERIGAYRLMDRIGAGGMGIVYTATHETLDRVVAIKLLPTASVVDASMRERFLREARTMAQLRHRHIVPIHDVIATDEVAAIAMEFVPGADLGQILTEWMRRRSERHDDVLSALLDDEPSTPFEGVERFVVKVGFEVAQALSAAHAAGVLHRDVKPSNIRVRAGDRAALLVDFGVARRADDEVTITTGFVGTPSFAAPEQLAGRDVDERSDIYSLGLTLHRGLCRTLGEVEVAQDARPRIRDVVPSASADLEAVLWTALEPDPRDRYASAAAFARDLRAILDGGPVTARPRGPVTRAYHWVARDRVRLGLATILIIAAVLGAVLWREWPNIALGQAVERERTVDALLHTSFVKLLDPATRSDAITAFDAVEQIAPGQPDAALGRIAALCLENRIEEARTFIADDRHDFGEALSDLQALLAESPVPPPSTDGIVDSERLRTIAMVQYVTSLRTGHAEDFAAAAESLDRLRFLEPKARELHHGILAYAAKRGGRTELAERAMLGLERLWPDSASAHAWIAIVAGDTERDRAARSARLAIALDPSLEPFLAGITISALAMSGDTEAARRELMAALQRHPRAGQLRVVEGKLAQANGDDAAAVEAYRAALALAPRDPAAHSALGQLLWSRDRDAAIPHLIATTELLPTLPQPHINLGRARFMAKDYEAARQSLARAVELSPNDGVAVCLLGESLYRLADPQAAHWLSRATELDDGNPRAFYYLAAAQHRAGDLNEALTHAERALELVEGGATGISPSSARSTVRRLRQLVERRR